MRFVFPIMMLATVAGAAQAAPPPAQFAAMSAASDLFEVTSSQLLVRSANLTVRAFAFDMIADHTKSAALVKAAAIKAGLKPAPPTMTPRQRADLKALGRTSDLSRDALYISQQKAAHADALVLLRDEAASGRPRALRAAAAKILPVVRHHKIQIDNMQR